MQRISRQPKRYSRRAWVKAHRLWRKSGAYPFFAFLKEIIKDPKSMGAACPSSKRLARAMAASIPMDKEGIILELGGGTGVITREILARGIDPARLYVIERSPRLCVVLRRRFPNVHIVEGDAACLSQHIPPAAPIAAVVSGLPLRSLPQTVVRALGIELEKLLPKGSTFILFTYALKSKSHYTLPLVRVQSRTIWNNIPPARVDVCHSL